MSMQDMMMQDESDIGFLDAFDEEVKAEQQAQEKRRPVQGRLLRFYMPQKADSDGTRKATIRLRTPIDKVARIIEHYQYNKYHFVCPAEFGFDCQICKRLMKKIEVPTRGDLLKPANLIEAVRGEGEKKTRWLWMWQIWYYQAFMDREGEPGGNFLLAEPRNENSPVPRIMAKHKALYVDVDEDQEPIWLNDIDLQLVQTGEKTKKSFDVNEKVRRDKVTGKLLPFKYEARSRLWTPLEMKIGLALAITDKDSELFTRYQSYYQKCVSEEKVPPPEEWKKRSDVEEEEEVISLTFEDGDEE